jgi:hypothetical protein
MTATIRTTEPNTITTREEVHWKKTYTNYPASLWQLNYYFRGPGVGFNAAWATEVTADGDDFDIVVPASKTDDVTVAGIYTWQAWLTEIADTTNKIKIGEGRTEIKIGFDPASTVSVETRSAAKIMLDTIDAALLAFATSDILEYEITTPAGGRRIKRSDKSQLISDRKYWAGIVTNELARERSRNGQPLMPSVKMVVYDD